MKRGIKFVLFSMGMVLLWGCYPGGPDYYEELDVSLSKHNPDYDFAGKSHLRNARCDCEDHGEPC